jgi:uncharacterized membrane protein
MNIEGTLYVVTLVAALGCGLMGGLFFAFSVSVMRALARLRAPEGMRAMQAINIAILNPVFLGAFLGTGLLCAIAVAAALLGWHDARAVWLLAGGVTYLVGTVLVTMVLNVPMNDALAAAAPDDPASADTWADYLRRWTAWNHVRAISSVAASALFTVALA